jgi:hypothetical protein
MNEEMEQSFSDPPKMSEVVEKFNKLQDEVSNVGSKLSDIMSQQEEEFLLAFQQHCFTVQNDLRDLKREWEEKEAALTNNDRIKKIEIERDWYKNEALRLDIQLQQNSEKLMGTKKKLEEIKLDHECLSKKFHEVLNERNALQQDSKKNYPIISTLLSK